MKWYVYPVVSNICITQVVMMTMIIPSKNKCHHIMIAILTELSESGASISGIGTICRFNISPVQVV